MTRYIRSKRNSLPVFVLIISMIIFVCFPSCVYANPLAAIRSIRSIQATYRLFVTVPRTANQFANVYKASASIANLANISRGTESLNKISNNLNYWDKESQKKEFWKSSYENGYRGTPYSKHGLINENNFNSNLNNDINFDIIIGHSHGDYLYLSDGGRVNYNKVYELSRSNGNILILISCNSKKHLPKDAVGISGKISYNNAVEVAKDVVKRINNYDFKYNRNLKKLRLDLVTDLQGFTFRRKLYNSSIGSDNTIIYVSLTVGGSVVVYVVVDKINSDE
jgi:hypothetical protein